MSHQTPPPLLVSCPPSSAPTHNRAKSRLSLAALCNPTPSPPTMAAASPAPVPSSSLTSSPDESRDLASEPLSLSTEDENVMIAVRALGDMRSGASPAAPSSNRSVHRYSSSPPHQTPGLTTASTPTSPSTVSANLSLSPEETAAAVDFVSRVSDLPIVNTALRAYEQSKASSRMVKYGAEMMESSVKSISKPVINRLPVNQLDEFACRQLDKFGRKSSSGTSPGARGRSPSVERVNLLQDSERNSIERDDGRPRPQARFSIGDLDQDDVRSQGVDETGVEADERALPTQDVANRSRWHSILYEAGGISAAVSEESMRRLKYCLQWLQYATEHIDGQILVIRNFIASLNMQGEGSGDERHISASHMQTLTNVKRDVVGTIRQVVDVVSKYAGGALPEPARARVRQFILHLPQRWTNTTHRQMHSPAPAHLSGQPKGAGKRRRREGPLAESRPASAASTAPSSPLQSPKVLGHGALPLPAVMSTSHRQATAARPTAGSAAQAAQRLLTLATESLDMMRSVTSVFKESLDRADTWVDRLRVIGIQRQQNPDASVDSLPPLHHSHHARSESLSYSASSNSTGLSGSTTATFTSFPPSPRTWPADAPSPGELATTSLDALTLSSLSASASAFATPRSSTQSLPALAGYDWEYTTRKLQTIRDTDKIRADSEVNEKRENVMLGKSAHHVADERFAASALSSLRRVAADSRDVSMEVDDND
ncbi:Opi1-domain-containing protein [Phellopilus nigrolimitatus]|nr:Opi1-domain-containing protein [Phellopilus nigrolimitatus]